MLAMLTEYVWLVAAFILGFSSSFIFRKSANGTLRIDHSNPAKDIYRFEVDDIDKLSKKKRIVLKVDNHADLSQK